MATCVDEHLFVNVQLRHGPPSCSGLVLFSLFEYLDISYLLPFLGGADMGRPKLNEPRDQQLLVRVTKRHMAVLEAAAFLDEATPAGLAHHHLTAWLDLLQGDPNIQTVIKARASHSRSHAQIHTMSDARPRTSKSAQGVRLESSGDE